MYCFDEAYRKKEIYKQNLLAAIDQTSVERLICFTLENGLNTRSHLKHYIKLEF